MDVESSLLRTSRATADPEAAPGPGAGEDPQGKDPAAEAAVAGTPAHAPRAAANLVLAPGLGEVDPSHPGVAVALDRPRK